MVSDQLMRVVMERIRRRIDASQTAADLQHTEAARLHRNAGRVLWPGDEDRLKAELQTEDEPADDADGTGPGPPDGGSTDPP